MASGRVSCWRLLVEVVVTEINLMCLTFAFLGLSPVPVNREIVSITNSRVRSLGSYFRKTTLRHIEVRCHFLARPTMTAEQIINDVSNQRYSLTLDGINEPAFLTYVVRPEGSEIVYDLTHTYVTPAMRGRGVAARLVQYAVDHARQSGHKIIPTCSYITTYMERHPSDRDVLLS